LLNVRKRNVLKVSWDCFSLVICPIVFLGAMFVSGELIGFYLYQSIAGEVPENLYFKCSIVGGGLACLCCFVRTVSQYYRNNVDMS